MPEFDLVLSGLVGPVVAEGFELDAAKPMPPRLVQSLGKDVGSSDFARHVVVLIINAKGSCKVYRVSLQQIFLYFSILRATYLRCLSLTWFLPASLSPW